MKPAAQQLWEAAVTKRNGSIRYLTWAELPEIYKAKWEHLAGNEHKDGEYE